MKLNIDEVKQQKQQQKRAATTPITIAAAAGTTATMTGTNAIMALLKTHPISLKDNLQSICSDLNIEFDLKETRTELQVKIDDHSKTNQNTGEKVRNLVKKMKTMHRERITSSAETGDKTLKTPKLPPKKNQMNTSESPLRPQPKPPNKDIEANQTQSDTPPLSAFTQPPLFDDTQEIDPDHEQTEARVINNPTENLNDSTHEKTQKKPPVAERHC